MTVVDIAKPSPLMAGKRGLIMGVANDRSIAYGIARVLAGQGAELAFTYQGDAFGRRAVPLAQGLGAKIILPCDVLDLNSVDAVFSEIASKWGSIDFLVHALAFSDRNELKGRYADTTRENFINTMVISCFSFTEIAKRAAALMKRGGSMITLTYGGSMRVVPRYNVMGVAKAALEASVRYLAVDFGQQNIRVNGLSPGPMRTLAGAGISDARVLFNYQKHAFATRADAFPGRGWRCCALPPFRSFDGRHRRSPLCGFGLQYRSDAPDRDHHRQQRRRTSRGTAIREPSAPRNSGAQRE